MLQERGTHIPYLNISRLLLAISHDLLRPPLNWPQHLIHVHRGGIVQYPHITPPSTFLIVKYNMLPPYYHPLSFNLIYPYPSYASKDLHSSEGMLCYDFMSYEVTFMTFLISLPLPPLYSSPLTLSSLCCASTPICSNDVRVWKKIRVLLLLYFNFNLKLFSGGNTSSVPTRYLLDAYMISINLPGRVGTCLQSAYCKMENK